MSDEPTNPQNTPRWAVIVLSTAAAICLITSLYLAITDKVAAGTLTAGLFAVCVLFIYIPRIQSFRAWGIEVALRNALANSVIVDRRLVEFQSVVDELREQPTGTSKEKVAVTVDKVDKAATQLSTANNALSASLATALDVASGRAWPIGRVPPLDRPPLTTTTKSSE
jgi:stalled ribosome rescue protein Dom34